MKKESKDWTTLKTAEVQKLVVRATKKKVTCGDANPSGNIQLTYKGGCREKINIEDAYRCVGCGGWFHKDCMLKHFSLEKDHDWGRQREREAIAQDIRSLDSILSGAESEVEIRQARNFLKEYFL